MKRKVYNLGKLGFNQCVDFGYYHYNRAEPLLETHYHKDVLEICYCLKGQQYYQIGKELLKMTGNSILIVPPNIDHSTGSYPEDIGELFWLQVSLQKGKGNLCNLPNDQSDYLLEELIKSGNTIFKGAFDLKHILEKILETLDEPKSVLKELSVNQLIVQLLLDTLMLSKKPQHIVSSERFNVINDFIIKNLNRTIYIDELAALVGVSVVYFKFWFKNNFGIPPRAYINRLKIEQAKENLSTKKTVTQIAFEMGFSSSQYFTTVFKKHTGLTPKSYIGTRNK